MNLLHRSIASVGVLSALATLAAAVPNPGEPTVTLTPTALGCDITVRAHNASNSSVTIDLEDSEVKVKNGLWSKLNQGGNWVVGANGSQESKVVSLDLGCSFDRQYKFLMRAGSNEKYIYFPDGNGFTESKSLGLADVGRHFK